MTEMYVGIDHVTGWRARVIAPLPTAGQEPIVSHGYCSRTLYSDKGCLSDVTSSSAIEFNTLPPPPSIHDPSTTSTLSTDSSLQRTTSLTGPSYYGGCLVLSGAR